MNSPAATTKYPAPVRERYFTPTDYAAACMRVHGKRADFDKKNHYKPIGQMAQKRQRERRSGQDRRGGG